MLTTILTLLSVLSLYLFSPLGTLSNESEQVNTVFNNVNIIDVSSGNIQYEMSIAVAQGIIKNIGPTKSFETLTGYRSVNANGKFVIPGLWDMHTHSLKISPQIHHPLYIGNGVTSVRDLSGCMNKDDSFWACIEDRKIWTKEALKGQRISPRYALQSSYQVDGGAEVPDGYSDFFRINSQADANELVKYYESKGADFVKIHAGVSQLQYDYLVSALQASKLYLVGHKPLKVSLTDALASGQRSLEHGRIFLFACSPSGKWLREHATPYKAYNADFQRQLLQTQDAEKCQGLMKSMAITQSWWVPTLTTLKSSAFAQEYIKLEDKNFEYVPYLMKELFWKNDLKNALEKGKDSQQNFVHNDFYEKAKQYLAKAHQNGVKVLVGTDTLDTAVVAGVSVHDEMMSLVEAGLLPIDALRAATISAARFASQEKKYGSIEVGKVADLVLLNANPLLNIANTKDIDSVIFNGIYFQQQQLTAFKQFVKDQAQSAKLNAHYLASVIMSPLMRQQIAD